MSNVDCTTDSCTICILYQHSTQTVSNAYHSVVSTYNIRSFLSLPLCTPMEQAGENNSPPRSLNRGVGASSRPLPHPPSPKWGRGNQCVWREREKEKSLLLCRLIETYAIHTGCVRLLLDVATEMVKLDRSSSIEEEEEDRWGRSATLRRHWDRKDVEIQIYGRERALSDFFPMKVLFQLTANDLLEPFISSSLFQLPILKKGVSSSAAG